MAGEGNGEGEGEGQDGKIVKEKQIFGVFIHDSNILVTEIWTSGVSFYIPSCIDE